MEKPYFPKIRSLGDVFTWLPRFFLNQPIQYAAGLGLLLTVPLLLVVLLQDRGKPVEIPVEMPDAVWLRTGMLDGNVDSLRLRRGQSLVLLARQGSSVWASTPDGSNRGYVRAADLGDLLLDVDLPDRNNRSSYYISQARFDELMAEPATDFDKLERSYLPAEYLRSERGKSVAEYGFYVLMPNGQRRRPVVTFAPDGSVLDYRLEPFRSASGPLSAMAAGEELTQHGSSAASTRWIDVASPLISTPDVGRFNPFGSVWSDLLWVYLIGYVPFYIFMLLLWLRKPLKWLPNILANAVAYLLCLVGPVLWYLLLRVQGVSAWPMLIVALGLLLLSLWTWWVSYSYLRCPRCKVMELPEYIRSTRGAPFKRQRPVSDTVSRVNLKHTVDIEERTTHHQYRGKEVYRTEKHHYTDRVTVEYGIVYETVQRTSKHYVCRHCGYGSSDVDEQILSSRYEPTSRRTTTEERTDTKYFRNGTPV